MLEQDPDPLLALLPSVVSSTPATEPEDSLQAMETTRSTEDEALPLVEQPEVDSKNGLSDQLEAKVQEDTGKQQDQLPTPSPSSHSTLSSAKLVAPPSPSTSTISSQSKRKRAISRVFNQTQPEEEEKEDETKGRDGKEYQLCGMYYSPGITPKNPSLSRSNAVSSTSSPRARRSTTVTYSWRTIKPSKETILPPPIHYGLMLLGEAPEVFRKIDEPDSDDEEEEDDDSADEEDEPECSFKLPFDILRDFYYAEDAVVSGKGGQRDETTEDVEKRETSRKPAHYRHLQTNFYVDRKPDRIDVAAVCMCQPPEDKTQQGCLETCINRMMQYCCDPKICPCGAQCSNVPLNKRQTIEEGKNGLKVIWTGNRGFGLKTMVPIRKGELVIEYRGEIISRDESYKRVLNEYKDRSDYYFLEYDSLEVLDAGQKGNSSRFINHSCGPNCEVVRWRLASVDEYQVGIFAKRDIQAGEELTYNYGWQNFVDMADSNSEKPAASTSTSTSASPRKSKASKAAEEAANDIARQRCFCGSPVCSGYLGGKPKDERALAAGPSSKTKGKGKANPKLAEVKEKPVKEKKQPPVKLEWVKAKIVLGTSSGRKMSGRAESEESEGGVKKKLKSGLSGLSRAGSLRGAAAKAKEKLTGQR